MKDWKTLLALLLLIVMVGILIVLSLDNRAEGFIRDRQVSELRETVSKLEKRQFIQPLNGKDGKTPVKGIDYFDGKDGTNGKDGKDGKSIVGPKGDTGEKGEKGDPAPEIDISCIAGMVMKHYTGDLIWQPTNIKCEVADE